MGPRSHRIVRGSLVLALVAAPLLVRPVLGSQEPPPAPAPAPAPEETPATFRAGVELEARWTDATAFARRKNRRLLTIWGRNGDRASEALVSALGEKPLARPVLYEYRLTTVDALGGEPTTRLARRLQADLGKGLPFVTVHDADGALLASGPGSTWIGREGLDAQAFATFLERHACEPLDAREELAAAMRRANEEKKLVYVHTTTPWCVWCTRLESFLARPRVAAILQQDYVLLEIDPERMENAAELIERLTGGAAHGDPFSAVIDTEDRLLVTSAGPDGNVGCPLSPEELDWFVSMLERTRQRIRDEDLQVLREEHVAFARPILEELRGR